MSSRSALADRLLGGRRRPRIFPVPVFRTLPEGYPSQRADLCDAF